MSNELKFYDDLVFELERFKRQACESLMEHSVAINSYCKTANPDDELANAIGRAVRDNDLGGAAIESTELFIDEMILRMRQMKVSHRESCNALKALKNDQDFQN